MRAKAIASLLAAAAVAVLLLPAAAFAADKPASRQFGPAILQQLELRGTDGFEVQVDVENRRKLIVSAGGGPGSAIEGVTYTLPTRQARGFDGIRARVGKLGHIDVRFVPGRAKEHQRIPGCRGGKTVVEKGHFAGLIDFRGEHGYTRVRAHRAAGSITRVPVVTCDASRKKPKHKKGRSSEKKGKSFEEELAELEEKGEFSFEVLALTATAPRNHVFFAATRSSAGAPGEKISSSDFLVSGVRHRGKIKEESIYMDLLDKGAYFRPLEPLVPESEALIKPPTPFSGSAVFRRYAARSKVWTGDLRIDLPGFGVVRLAGPGTQAAMCEGFSCGTGLGHSTQRLLRRLEPAGLLPKALLP